MFVREVYVPDKERVVFRELVIWQFTAELTVNGQASNQRAVLATQVVLEIGYGLAGIAADLPSADQNGDSGRDRPNCRPINHASSPLVRSATCSA